VTDRAEGEEGERTGRRKGASKKWPIMPKVKTWPNRTKVTGAVTKAVRKAKKANEPDEGENEPLKLRKTAAEKLFVFGMQRHVFQVPRCRI
jgi:hypothetical protein